MHGLSDEALIAVVIQGDPRAYEQLVLRHQDAVARFVWRLVPDDRDREEVCQDVFVKVYLNLRRFKFEAKFTTWLYSIAYRTAISALRKKRLVFEPMDETIDPATPVSFDEVMGDDELARVVNWEVQRLGTDDRSIVTLFHVAGCSVEEIGEIMGKPSGTIKSALFRVRKKLKGQLAPRLSDSAVYREAQ